MTGDDLKAEREARGMEPSAFGKYLAELMGLDRAYTRQEVSQWERGVRGRGVPVKVELALVKVGLRAPAKKKRKVS